LAALCRCSAGDLVAGSLAHVLAKKTAALGAGGFRGIRHLAYCRPNAPTGRCGRPAVVRAGADCRHPHQGPAARRDSSPILRSVRLGSDAQSRLPSDDPDPASSEIMRWLKAATANRANRLLGRTGTEFWQREHFDRWIRTEKQLGAVIGYVDDNPVRSGLAPCPEAWKWSSAYQDTGGKTAGATNQ
jgi:hypothetical protein